jgi:dihydrofolate reductase
VKIILIAALTRFKRLTTGHAVLMGRTTFDSIGKPLPNRRNVVLTSRPIEAVECHASLAAALRALAEEELVFVIGGGMIYTQTIEMADALELTIVENSIEGDTWFPPYEHLIGPVFSQTQREPHEGFVFEEYRRV